MLGKTGAPSCLEGIILSPTSSIMWQIKNNMHIKWATHIRMKYGEANILAIGGELNAANKHPNIRYIKDNRKCSYLAYFFLWRTNYKFY